jgi:hypothetical protein
LAAISLSETENSDFVDYRLTGQVICAKVQSIWSLCSSVITIAGLRIPRRPAQYVIRIVEEEMSQAMIMAIHHNTLMLFDYLNERREIGFIVRC